MITSYVRIFCSVFILSFLLELCGTWKGLEKDQRLLLDMGHTLVADLARKAETVWYLKDDFGKYKTFGIGEKVFLLRTKYADMVRLALRSRLTFKKFSTTQMIRNLTNLQRMTQEVFLFMDELIKFDNEVMSQDKVRNESRIKIGEGCQAAGTMVVPPSVLDKFRRQIIDARRQHIANTYLKVPPKPPIDIDNELNAALNPTPARGPDIKKQDTVIMDLAPDVM